MKKTIEILDCQESFVQLLTVSPKWRRQQFVQEFGLDDIISSLGSSERTTRDLAAKSFGILVAEQANSSIDVQSIFSGLLDQAKSWNSSSGEEFNKACGAISALTHAFVRLGNLNSKEVPQSILAELNFIIASIICKSKSKESQEAAFDAFGQLGIWLIYGAQLSFPVPNLKVEDKEVSAELLVENVAIQAKAGNERAITALGRFSVWLSEESHENLLKEIYKEIRACHEIRQTESQFAVGEALSCLAFGSDNTAILTEFDSTEEIPKGPARTNLLKQVLKETLKGCKESKPSLQRASVIWLLSLVQFGGHHPAVQQLLTQCQRAFMSTLGNRDELVQEASARGLGLVYEKGDKKLRDALVEDLVASFSDTKPKISGTVTEDTELFSEGILRTHDGSISTYKDILDLASEVGDPSLVYRFMSLAANNAIWTSRAAFGNFGLSTILSDSGYLSSNPKLFPALYRYQFDPNPNVQRSMKSLWQSLVKEPQKTLDDNFDTIMNELLKHILGREWRAREASCRAIADLVQDRKFDKYEKYMDEIWTSCSKVMDDIKGSVRAAARTLSLTLTNILVRSLEAGDSSKSTMAMLDHVIPFLLSTSGVEARAKDVQGWAVSTLLTVIKKSRGTILESHIPLLLESIIGMFSSLEHDMVNYLHLNADKYNMTTSQIDELRLKATRSSPLMDAVEKLIDAPFKDQATPDKIVTVLEKSVRSSLGMPSQTATSRILVSMFVRHHARYKPHADRFLRAIQKPLLDRNDAVASSYAYAAGYLARWASDEQVRKSAEYAWNLWETSENDRHRAVAAEVFAAFAKHASERFSSLSETMLPYVFIGKHDDQEDVQDTFKSTWSESTSGPRAVLLHLDAIVSLSISLLDAPRWTLKHAGARAISEVSETIAGLDKAVSPAQAPKVWPALVKAIGGKSWEGKEVVLKAFGAFVDGIRPFWERDPKIAEEMSKVSTHTLNKTTISILIHASDHYSRIQAPK
jgi:proteasome component ECM29